ncbi:hypothetical protein [Haliea sp. E17]|uniref:hypothetical protein n=1 Tax=Haliea sp. E17 TaxID=3401576 RepID=UPI003AAA8E5D
MLFHASIPAENCERVAQVLAEIWQGSYAPFPPCPGGYIAMAGDDRGTEIEVFPWTCENHIGEVELDIVPRTAGNGHSACHLAVATPLEEEDILAIASREGWTARVCDRGGCFHVIEVWLENRFLVEVLTAPMQAEYVAFLKPEVWEKTFGGVRMANSIARLTA